MESKQDPRRNSDIVLAELKIEFRDFLDRYERNHADTHKWREDMENDINKLATDLSKIMVPYRITSWLAIPTCTAVIIKIVSDFIDAIKTHIK